MSLPGSRAFTLLEILVAITLLSIIVLGLFAMFNQVQRAFRSSMTQSDILEAGRAVTEMMPRELEQTALSDAAFYPYPDPNYGVNFYTYIPNSTPLIQPLPGSTVGRTNLLEDCFLLQRQNQTWVGIGYCVRSADTNGVLWYPESEPGKMGVGTLYRWVETNAVSVKGFPQDPGQLYRDFAARCTPGTSNIFFTQICEGVIHFRVRPFNTNGVLITTNYVNINIRNSTIAPGEVGRYLFGSNAVPAAVELELGLLEQHAWERYNSIASATARSAYLRRDDISSRVHLFRQRIPIRNVDPLAYQ